MRVLMVVVEAMVIRVCGAIWGRGGGGARTFASVRGASGPVRYNPSPGSAKPARGRETRDAGVSHSRPLPRWKRAPETETEWGLRKREEQKRYWDDAGRDTTAVDASAELQRLKAEMQSRDSSPQARDSSPQFLTQTSPPPSHRREKIRPIEAIPAIAADSETLPAVAKHQKRFGSGLFYGDGRKFEAPNSSASSSNSTPKTKPLLQGSGLFYGDGRKFEGLLPDATHLFTAADEDALFTTAETEEDKTLAKEKQTAKNYALRLLGMAPQTAHKLRQKLIGRSVSEPVIESTIADLQRCGLQSDLEYAEAFARSRWRSALWGPQRLKQELRQRGVCPDDIAAAIAKVFITSSDGSRPDGSRSDDSCEEAVLWGMTRAASDHLLEKARLQWARGGGTVSAEARKRRMIGWLQRRGFDWSITSEVLKALESEEKQMR